MALLPPPLQAAQYGGVNASAVRLYLDLSELGRSLLQQHFNLTSHLHYSYTHLVCRTASNGKRASQCHLSASTPAPPPPLPQMLRWFAATSATRCMQTTVSWIKTGASATRSHQPTPGGTTGVCGGGGVVEMYAPYLVTHSSPSSSILYLNGDFQGGKFFFAHGPKDLSPQVMARWVEWGALPYSVMVPIPIPCVAICDSKVWTNGWLLCWSGEHAWCHRGDQGAEVCSGTVVHAGPNTQGTDH